MQSLKSVLAFHLPFDLNSKLFKSKNPPGSPDIMETECIRISTVLV